ncbi:T9SS type A sorting domain-containing protein [Polaribacter marinaquae]|uniref:T9SS type A sorting domain-containing protein n=1 Tax=Polaribacter marinaquae TaxID=1642819 RepID=A0ABZ2TSC5_9FLAO
MKKLLLILISTAITSINAQNKNSLDNFISNEGSLHKNTTSVVNYLPKTGVFNSETTNISQPSDLLTTANANEIFIVDYYKNNKKVSTVLASKTKANIYDHSKVIYDRFYNDLLEDITILETRGHQIICSKIKRANGKIEYSLNFSIRENTNENELFSFWNRDQYPTGKYQNFQIWGSSYLQVEFIANFIIDKQTRLNGLKSLKNKDIIPNVFVKSGSYANGLLKLIIINKTSETAVILNSNIAATEIYKHKKTSKTIALFGAYTEVLQIETGILFDIGFTLQTNNSVQKDALYLADGPWGLDYLNEYATINNFKINVKNKSNSEKAHKVDRNASVTGEVKGNVNLFRHLLPRDQTLDVKNYSFVNFASINNKPVEIVIMQEDGRTWDNRLRYSIPATSELRNFSIPFSDFKDANGNSAVVTNIKTIVFSVIGDYTNFVPFDIEVNDLSFTSITVLNQEEQLKNSNAKPFNYPNPFSSNTTMVLSSSSSYIILQVYDSLGRVVDTKKIDTDSTQLRATYKAPNLKNGQYKYLLKDEKGKTFSGTFLIN